MATGTPRDRAGTSDDTGTPRDDDDDEVEQRDDDHRFVRYGEVIGTGRFKQVFKGFDEKAGIDIAWGVISGEHHQLDEKGQQSLLEEMKRGICLSHQNIIKCFKCWASGNHINLITELFTSGNLRDYRQQHKHLDSNALRKFCRQILQGLSYLHAQEPAVVHGDLRCDKIYVNGHSGEIKIGDLGLITLLAQKYQDSETGSPYQSIASDCEEIKRHPDFDIFSFGMCMLELYTQTETDPEHQIDLPACIAPVEDKSAQHILTLCLLSDPSARPTAAQLLEHVYFTQKRPTPSPSRNSTPPLPDYTLQEHAERRHLHPPTHSLKSNTLPVRKSCPNGLAELNRHSGTRCCVKGEDFTFTVEGSNSDFQHDDLTPDVTVPVRLTMASVDKQADGKTPCFQRTITFKYHTSDDNPESLSEELKQAFQLSETDTDIASAVIKEWLHQVQNVSSDENDVFSIRVGPQPIQPWCAPQLQCSTAHTSDIQSCYAFPKTCEVASEASCRDQ